MAVPKMRYKHKYRQAVSLEMLESRLLLASAALVGVDFDQEADSPAGWTSQRRFYPFSALENLSDEEGHSTPWDLTLSVSDFDDDFAVNLKSNTIPTHSRSLAGLNGGIDFFEDLVATWSDLEPGAKYEVYVFELQSVDPDLNELEELSINGQIGSSSRPLSSYANVMTASPTGTIVLIFGPQDIAGLAISSSDIKAVGLDYADRSTNVVADDYVAIRYDLARISQNTDVALSLYWSFDDPIPAPGSTLEQRLFRNRLATAFSTPNAEHDGEMTIPASAIAATRPADQRITHLLLHVDDVPGKTDGDITAIEGDDDGNNYASLSIVPEIDPDDSSWDPDQGGLNVAFNLTNPAFITKPIMVEMKWSGNDSSRLAGSRFAVSRDMRTHHVNWEDINVPRIGDLSLELEFDPDDDITELNDSKENNTVREGVGDWKPEVLFVIPVAFRKESYDVAVTIKNKAPIGMNVDLFFKETFPEGVVMTPTLSRTSPSVSKLLGFGEASSGQVTLKLSALDGKNLFNRTWDWIPPENFMVEAQKLLADYAVDTLNGLVQELSRARDATAFADSVALITGAKDIYELIQTFANPEPLVAEVNISYLVEAKALVGAIGQLKDSTAVVKLHVPQKRKDFLAEFQRAAGSAKVINNLAIGLLVETGGISGALLVPGLLEWQRARDLYRQALDPPSPDYMTLVDLQVKRDLLDGYSLSGALGSFANQRLVLSAITDAVNATEDRILGASEAGNAEWEAKQRESLSFFQHRAAIEGIRQVGLSSVMKPWFATVLANYGTSSAGSDFTLPEAMRSELVARGASEEDLDLIESTSAAENLRSPIGADLMMWFDSHNAVLNAISAYRSLKEAIALRTGVLGQPVLSLPAGSIGGLTTQRTLIEDALLSDLPSDNLRRLIEDYLLNVRTLILDTNDIEGLGDSLEFGYASLLTLQLKLPSVEGLQSFVNEQVTAGSIEAETAQLLLESLGRASDKLATGEFFEGGIALENVLLTVAEHEGSGINSETAQKLSGTTRYVQSLAFGNRQPLSIEIDHASVLENQSGAIVGMVIAIDPDVGDSHSFLVDDGRFEFDGNVLKLKPGVRLDFEVQPQVLINVTATDSEGLSKSQALTVAVTNVNEAPTDVRLSRGKAFTGIVGAWIAGVTVADPDVGDHHSFVINDSRFEVRGGNLYLKPNQMLPTTPSTVSLTITASDAGPTVLSVARNFTLTLEAPPSGWDHGFQWKPRPADVNADGIVSPLDAVLVINNLNARGPYSLPVLAGGTAAPLFLDVSGDGDVTPLDALLLIITLNAGGGGEGEASGDAFSETPQFLLEPPSQTEWPSAEPSSGLPPWMAAWRGVPEPEFEGWQPLGSQANAYDAIYGGTANNDAGDVEEEWFFDALLTK
jgi:hypothetical protein